MNVMLLAVVHMLLVGFRVSIQSPLLVRITCTPNLRCGHFSILTIAITLNRKGIPPTFGQKILLSLPDAAKKKSIVLEIYYSELSKAVMGRPQETRQIDHVSLILSEFPKKKSSSGKLMYFICS